MNTEVVSAVDVDGVTIRYGNKVAVDNVSLHIARGSVYAILGRNGAGKSSLIRALLGQQRPAAGSIRLLGENVWTHRATLMERVGVVPEDSDAPPDQRVESLARFWSSLYARWSAPMFEERLQRFHIAGRMKFGDLSKGQKKQVMLALALATSPELLILDDPTLGLDAVARKSLFEEVIAELADRGITVLMTTHDLAGVETIADRVAVMHEGRVVIDEDLDALKSRFRRVRFAARPVAIASGRNVRAWGSGAEMVVSDYRGNEPAGATEVSPMSLEEIFIAVTGEES